MTEDTCCTRLLCEAARSLRRVQDLEVEHREVEGQAQTDGVRGCHVLVGQGGRALVGLESFVCGGSPEVPLLKLCQIPQVVPLHLVVENLPCLFVYLFVCLFVCLYFRDINMTSCSERSMPEQGDIYAFMSTGKPVRDESTPRKERTVPCLEHRNKGKRARSRPVDCVACFLLVFD